MRVITISPRVAELVLCITKRYKLKVVQVYAPTTSYSEEDINSFYNDVDETLGKPNHYTIVTGDINAQIWEKNKPYGNDNGQIWARIENRQRRHLGRMVNIKKVHNHEYHVPEEGKEEMDVEKPKRCNEDRN